MARPSARRSPPGGAKVIVSDITLGAGERLASEIGRSGGTATAFLQNTAKPADCEAVVRHAVQTYGGLHFAVDSPGTPPRNTGRTASASIASARHTSKPPCWRTSPRTSVRRWLRDIRRAGSAGPTRWRPRLFLLSDEASFMTGGYYLVDSGYTSVSRCGHLTTDRCAAPAGAFRHLEHAGA